ncbi:hypothetical protein NXF25_014351 [Crotalus adamanteus]|uniref:Uncharacterized protein n=1 Tax=Crotalus adamanteus TaxID=8729 RepID=A0AAW1AZR5_CROAD
MNFYPAFDLRSNWAHPYHLEAVLEHETAGNDKDSNVQYAELDTSVLTTSSPSHRTSVPVGGDLVEYATIQANVC